MQRMFLSFAAITKYKNTTVSEGQPYLASPFMNIKLRQASADDADFLFHLQRTPMQAYVVQTRIAWYDSINRFVESFYPTLPYNNEEIEA